MRAIDEEVFLLGTEGGEDALNSLVAKKLQQLDGFLGEHIRAAEQRRHLIECFTVVADEDGRNAEGARASRLDDEHRTGWIPRGVAAGFPGCPEPAGGKARSVGLALDQLVAG